MIFLNPPQIHVIFMVIHDPRVGLYRKVGKLAEMFGDEIVEGFQKQGVEPYPQQVSESYPLI